MPRVHFSDTLWVENFNEIALSRTVKEIEANLCFANFGKNSKIQNGRHFWGGENFFENCQEYIGQILVRYSVGRKFRRNRSISHGKGDRRKFVFSIFGKVAKLSYYSVSYIAIITKTNPKQAIDLSNAHTKFGKDMSNIFP